MPIKTKQKQEILEIVSVKERLHTLISIIQDEQELLSLEKKIGQKVKRSMERTQKEYFLREQMKAIQTELGDKEGKGGEVEELREKLNSQECLKKQ